MGAVITPAYALYFCTTLELCKLEAINLPLNQYDGLTCIGHCHRIEFIAFLWMVVFRVGLNIDVDEAINLIFFHPVKRNIHILL